MMNSLCGWTVRCFLPGAAVVLLLTPSGVQSHQLAGGADPLEVKAMPITTEGPAPKVGEARSTGRGKWTFVAAREGLLSVPSEAQPFVVGAHGTLVVDQETDTVFWGLEQVGWIAFSERLTRSAVVKGDPSLQRGNLHGADLLPRSGRRPLVAAADNVEGEVYLSDTSFREVQKVGWPGEAPYEKAEEYHPTDVAFVGPGTLYVTDGYGAAYFMAMKADPLSYQGEAMGGKVISRTPHGITWDGSDSSLVISARPEGQLKRWSVDRAAWTEVLGLPKGSTVCDIDIRGDYALAPCLNGPDRSPGPIYIVNLRDRTLVSTLNPKADLGFEKAQHIHDAAWYEVGEQLYVLFTNWNPGGIGALRLVR